jgi:hypothetical protein
MIVIDLDILENLTACFILGGEKADHPAKTPFSAC